MSSYTYAPKMHVELQMLFWSEIDREGKSRRSKIFTFPPHDPLWSVGEIEKSCGALPTTCVAIFGYTRLMI
jgi:hypothetical protein